MKCLKVFAWVAFPPQLDILKFLLYKYTNVQKII